MKIAAIELYEYELTYAHGEYVMSKGRAAFAQMATVVRILTDTGLEGWGETATLSGTYLPTFTGSTQASLKELAPHVIGTDPRRVSEITRVMDGILLGHANAKSAIDIACWDIFGKSVDLPISALLGGVLNPDFPLYEAVPLSAPDEMAEFVQRRMKAGINRFQLKVGNDPHEDAARTRRVIEETDGTPLIIADSNGGWTLQEATIAVNAMRDLDIYIEQPCKDAADCAIVRTLTSLPMIMDETVVTVADLFETKYQIKAGSLNLKLGRVGGITAATTMRNAAQNLGLSFCIEDIWGGDITTAAVAHVAASASPEHLLHASFFNDWTKEHVAGYRPRSVGGRGSAPTGPGLGIAVDVEALGKPIAVFN